MNRLRRITVLVCMVAAFSFAAIGCEGGGKKERVSEHPQKSEHPQGDHPKGEHPQGEHPSGEHPK